MKRAVLFRILTLSVLAALGLGACRNAVKPISFHLPGAPRVAHVMASYSSLANPADKLLETWDLTPSATPDVWQVTGLRQHTPGDPGRTAKRELLAGQLAAEQLKTLARANQNTYWADDSVATGFSPAPGTTQRIEVDWTDGTHSTFINTAPAPQPDVWQRRDRDGTQACGTAAVPDELAAFISVLRQVPATGPAPVTPTPSGP